MTFIVSIDWLRNGDYTDVGDDVTALVRPRDDALSLGYGRDQATALAPTISGRGNLTLDNRDARFAPRNTASPLYGKLKPARPVRITREIGGVTHILFDGHTDDSPINPDLAAGTVSLSLVDSLADFRGQDITTGLHRGIRTGEAVGLILDACGWPADLRDLDSGATVIRHWWESGTDALEALEKVVRSEGPPALLTMGADGEVVFRDRHHRLIRPASLFSLGTDPLAPELDLYPDTDLYPAAAVAGSVWRATGLIEPVMTKPFSYDEAWRNIVNSVAASAEVRTSGAEQVVWQADTTITLAAGESTLISASGADPFDNAVTPVAGTDFTVLSGAVTVELLRTSGVTVPIKISAAVPAAITGLQLRAQPVGVAYTVQVSAEDSASIEDYGRRGMPGDLPWCDPADAQAVLTRVVAQRANPLPVLSVRFLIGRNEARANALLGKDLSDRVIVDEPTTGLDLAPFYVESIQHDLTSEHDHAITFGLEAVPVEATPLLRFDDATAGFDLGRFGSGISDPSTILRFDTAGHGFDKGAWAL